VNQPGIPGRPEARTDTGLDYSTSFSVAAYPASAIMSPPGVALSLGHDQRNILVRCRFRSPIVLLHQVVGNPGGRMTSGFTGASTGSADQQFPVSFRTHNGAMTTR